MTSTAWATPAAVVRAGAVQVRLVADVMVRPVHGRPPTATLVAPVRLLKPEPLTVILPPVMGRAGGEMLATVAAPAGQMAEWQGASA